MSGSQAEVSDGGRWSTTLARELQKKKKEGKAAWQRVSLSRAWKLDGK